MNNFSYKIGRMRIQACLSFFKKNQPREKYVPSDNLGRVFFGEFHCGILKQNLLSKMADSFLTRIHNFKGKPTLCKG